MKFYADKKNSLWGGLGLGITQPVSQHSINLFFKSHFTVAMFVSQRYYNSMLTNLNLAVDEQKLLVNCFFLSRPGKS